MDVKVFNLQGKPVGQLKLSAAVWDGPVNTGLLSQAVAMYRTNRRAGTASTKTRAEVSGGGKKPWKQKHTARARPGSSRSPLWRHGGVIFGPRPHDRSYRLPQTMRRKALLESLKGKLRDEEIVVVDALSAEQPKTKPFAGLAEAFRVRHKSVVVLHEPSDPLIKSLRNLAAFDLRSAANLNAYDVLNAQKLLITKDAFARLEARVKEPAGDAPSN